MTDTPVSRLRELHRREYSSLMAGPWCRECTCTWPCDVIAALDALEARIDTCPNCQPFRAWLAGEPCPICGNAGVDAQGYECSCKEERQ